MTRDLIAGPDTGPIAPFPIKLSGQVIRGFGRGGKDLGIPTANIPIEGLDVGGHTDVESGIYYGWVGISLASVKEDATQVASPSEAHSKVQPPKGLISLSVARLEKARADVYPMVMSIGWNPVYKNEKRSVEVHVIHNFEEDFYGALMNVEILGFIRPERGDYDGLDDLIKDIKFDVEVAKKSLEREAYANIRGDPWLKDWDWAVAPLSKT